MTGTFTAWVFSSLTRIFDGAPDARTRDARVKSGTRNTTTSISHHFNSTRRRGGRPRSEKESVQKRQEALQDGRRTPAIPRLFRSQTQSDRVQLEKPPGTLSQHPPTKNPSFASSSPFYSTGPATESIQTRNPAGGIPPVPLCKVLSCGCRCSFFAAFERYADFFSNFEVYLERERMKRLLIILVLVVCICGIAHYGIGNRESDDASGLRACRVQMDAVPDEYTSYDGKITLVVRNNGSSPVVYGRDYSLEYYDEKKALWEEVVYEKISVMFELIAIKLEPHCTDTLRIRLLSEHHRFVPGKYRVVKDFRVESDTVTLEACFFIRHPGSRVERPENCTITDLPARLPTESRRK